MEHPTSLSPFDDGGVPPVAVCVLCGLGTCACEPPPSRALPGLPWEDASLPWAARLWETALVGSLDPQRTFGALPPGTVTSALVFGALAESLAVGSFAAWGVALAALVAPRWLGPLLASPGALTLGLGLLALVSLVMLALHAVWGVCLELGAGRKAGRRDLRQGLRFGLYACGWDLVTSPLGALCSLFTTGPLWRRLSPIAAAVRAPRLAQRAYLERCRGFDVAARRAAVQLCVLAFGLGLGLVLLAMAGGLLLAARRFGY